MIVRVRGGDFTVWKFIKNVPPRDLERTLGFEAKRLAPGFKLVVLADGEVLREDDLELGASTRWSGSWLTDHSGDKKRIEQVLHERGQSVADLKKKVCAFLNSGGDNRPAKVLPDLTHQSGMKYPHAEALGIGIRSGVPTFKLRTPKDFKVVKVVGENYSLLSSTI